MTLPIRKLETREESEKKRKRNTLILSTIMIAILLFSTAGYFSLRDESASSSNKAGAVENVGDSWILTVGDQTLRFSSSPESSKNVSILMTKNMQSFYGKTVYFASDSDALSYELASSLSRYTERLNPACYGPCDKDLPEKNCNDSLIVINSINFTGQGRIYEEGNCVFIEGRLDTVDAFLYKLFGVI